MTTSTIKRRRSPSANSPPNDDSTDNTMATPVSTTIVKNDSEEDSLDWTGNNYINPFIHRLNIENHMDLAKVSVVFLLIHT